MEIYGILATRHMPGRPRNKTRMPISGIRDLEMHRRDAEQYGRHNALYCHPVRMNEDQHGGWELIFPPALGNRRVPNMLDVTSGEAVEASASWFD